jgi:hypothetical protein
MTYEEQLQHWKGVDDPDWTQEEIAYEIGRLRALLRNPILSQEERKVVLDTLAFWEM